MIWLNLRVWLTSNTALAAAGAAAFVGAAVAVTLAIAAIYTIPALNVALLLLLPLGVATSFTSPRPARRRRAASVPVEAPTRVPGALASHPALQGCAGWDAFPTPGCLRRGRGKTPAAVGRPSRGAAAGPIPTGVTP